MEHEILHELQLINARLVGIAELLRGRGPAQAVTKTDLEQMEGRLSAKLDQIMAFEDDEIAAINALSTAADSFSLRADKVQTDITALIALVQTANPAPSQALRDAITKAQTSTAALAAAGDKTDAAIAAADKVLPAPAPAGA